MEVAAVEAEIRNDHLSLTVAHEQQSQNQGIKISEFVPAYLRHDRRLGIEGEVGRIAEHAAQDWRYGMSSIRALTSSSPLAAFTRSSRSAFRSALRSARLPFPTVKVLSP
jgi:hypothetical protein